MAITKRIKQNFFNENKKLYPLRVSPINVQYVGRYGYGKESPLRSDLKLRLNSVESPKEKRITASLNALLKSQNEKTMYVQRIEKKD